MYFVDRKSIEARLSYFEKLNQFLSKKKTNSAHLEEVLAYERAVHIMIEALLDVGNQMIDGFIMRDPGSYEDIIEILRDEKVIAEAETSLLLKWVQLRKNLVIHYHQVPTMDLLHTYREVQSALESFPNRIRTYLNEHLGPVSAFLPN